MIMWMKIENFREALYNTADLKRHVNIGARLLLEELSQDSLNCIF